MRLEGKYVPSGGFSEVWLYTRCKQVNYIPYDGTNINTALNIAVNEGLCPNNFSWIWEKIPKRVVLSWQLI